ncbi:hypothetical protein GQ44DRAFT_636449, partial [Phaeosphaeriaceae sp. PMI808]
ISPRNAINRIITTVVLPYSTYTSNINNKLLPALVSIIAIIGLSPTIIAIITSFCMPWNSAYLPIIYFNCAVISILLNRSY